MPSVTVENYLKEIYQAKPSQTDTSRVAMGEVARALGVVPGTATTMVKHLAGKGFLNYKPRVGVTLTPEGKRIALGILRRHRLIESFLVNTLGLPWDAIHEEAEQLEHAISDRVLDALDHFLGHPQADPHGDPIPNPEGHFVTPELHPLTQAPLDQVLFVYRITDQEPDFLKFIADHELRPGTSLSIIAQSKEADSLTIQRGETQQTLGRVAAAKILVQT